MIYWILLPFYLLLILFGCATCWLPSLFVSKAGTVPVIFIWWTTPDSNCFGADGDVGFRDANAHRLDTWGGRWWVCTKWLFRNSMNYLREYLLGVKSTGKGDTVKTVKATEKYSIDKTVFESGFGWQIHGSWYWNATKRFRWNIGWKLNQATKRDKCMMVFSIGPYCNR
ncbi:MAG: hypothetical protein GX776_08530 [Oxalobacter sp.]|nr:hypothetical protein [Oxalobacter sp.]